ncbi:hypothetical protein BHE74_00022108 [Ensete ventricosum]|nr:hypothetical protein BHE74_00022108 [Ensete ventricosum]
MLGACATTNLPSDPRLGLQLPPNHCEVELALTWHIEPTQHPKPRTRQSPVTHANSPLRHFHSRTYGAT